MAILSTTNVADIVAAILGVLKTGGAALAKFVQAEATKFQQSIETIGELFLTKEIGQQEANAQLSLQKAAAQNVLTSVEGIGGILAAQAINAGLQVVAAIVNKAIGFALI
jgi:hypothetical protein